MQYWQNFNVSGNSYSFAEILRVSFRYIIRIQILMIFNLKKGKKNSFSGSNMAPPGNPVRRGYLLTLREQARRSARMTSSNYFAWRRSREGGVSQQLIYAPR